MRLEGSERVAREIERSSQGSPKRDDPRAFREDRNKGFVDPEMLRVVDSDQLEHEKRVESCFRGPFANAHPEETIIAQPEECVCSGETCELCLSKSDIEAVPRDQIKDIKSLGKNVVGIEQFKVCMPVEVADTLDRVG